MRTRLQPVKCPRVSLLHEFETLIFTKVRFKLYQKADLDDELLGRVHPQDAEHYQGELCHLHDDDHGEADG